MPSPILELQLKIPAMERQYLAKNAEAALIDSFVQVIAQQVSRLVLQDEFSSDATLKTITASTQANLQAAFLAAIQDERNQRSIYGQHTEYAQLLKRVETTLGSDVEPETVQIAVPDVFMDEFVGAMAKEKKALQYLEEVKKHPVLQNYILPLLQQLRSLDKDGWHLQEGGAAKAYDVIKLLVDDMRYTISHREAEILYFLTYIPNNIRHIAQDLIVHHSYMDFVMEQRKAAKQNKRGTKMHDALLDMLRHSIFNNSHWYRMSNYEGSSESMNTDLAEYQRLCIGTQKKMMDLVQKNNSYAGVLRKFLHFTKTLFDRIKQLDRTYGSGGLQQTDIGHCFHDFTLHECYEVLNPKSSAYRNREKDGSIAVILEDDPKQRMGWEELIRDNSSFSIPGDRKTLFEKPSPELLEFADDQNVRLFLIDIENNNDRTAGITIVEQLLNRLGDNCHQESDVHREKYLLRGQQRQIVLWSTSPELVKIAQEHFSALVKEEKWKDILEAKGNFGSSQCPLKLEIQLKSDYISFTA